MADSLLHQLLLDSGTPENQWQLLAQDPIKKRLLLSELYEALTRDLDIMPLLVKVILQHRNDPAGSLEQGLFSALVARIREDHAKFGL